jgi:hypothetical protein
MLTVILTISITGILALLFVVVLRSRLKRFAMKLEVWKVRLSVEVESEPGAVKLPPAEKPSVLPEDDRKALMKPEQKALP